jgi:cytochrome b involved in lipid metabolism
LERIILYIMDRLCIQYSRRNARRFALNLVKYRIDIPSSERVLLPFASIVSRNHSSALRTSKPIYQQYTYGSHNDNTYNNNWWDIWKSHELLYKTILFGGSILVTSNLTQDKLQTRCEEDTTTTTIQAIATSTRSSLSTALTPSSVAKEDLDAIVEGHNVDELPIYSADEVAQKDGTDGKPIWMTYGGIIYDVTNFVPNHPGGSDKILQAAGTAIEPYWYTYRQHYNSDLPMRIMEHMAIGRLSEEDQNDIDEQMQVLEQNDPYVHEPKRHPSLRIHSDTPMNAEVPTKVLNQNYLTPNELFYIRNHHPVPYLTEKQLRNFRLQIDLSSTGKINENKDSVSDTTSSESNVSKNSTVISFTLDEIKEMPKTEVIVTLQCSGNRRGGYNTYQRTSGTPWGMY